VKGERSSAAIKKKKKKKKKKIGSRRDIKGEGIDRFFSAGLKGGGRVCFIYEKKRSRTRCHASVGGFVEERKGCSTGEGGKMSSAKGGRKKKKGVITQLRDRLKRGISTCVIQFGCENGRGGGLIVVHSEGCGAQVAGSGSKRKEKGKCFLYYSGRGGRKCTPSSFLRGGDAATGTGRGWSLPENRASKKK